MLFGFISVTQGRKMHGCKVHPASHWKYETLKRKLLNKELNSIKCFYLLQKNGLLKTQHWLDSFHFSSSKDERNMMCEMRNWEDFMNIYGKKQHWMCISIFFFFFFSLNKIIVVQQVIILPYIFTDRCSFRVRHLK